MSDHDEECLEDEGPSQEDLLAVAVASEAVRAHIDAALLRDASTSWRKMARLVATAMTELEEDLPEVSYAFYAHRLRELVAAGQLEFRGDLRTMRFCELRLPEEERRVSPNNSLDGARGGQ